jgi:hypothetical protein
MNLSTDQLQDPSVQWIYLPPKPVATTASSYTSHITNAIHDAPIATK